VKPGQWIQARQRNPATQTETLRKIFIFSHDPPLMGTPHQQREVSMAYETLERPGMTIRFAPLGLFATNCFVVRCAETGACAIVDSCADFEVIEAMVDAGGGNVALLLQTHAHIDHVAALGETKAAYGAPIVIHTDEMPLYDVAPMQGAMFGIHTDPLPPPDRFVEEGQSVTLGSLTAKVLLTPGHTPGGICFWFEDQNVVFSGDLLFAGSIGRTDLPGGDTPTIMRSLRRIVTDVPDDTLVLSGHGPQTSIGREKAHNPFVQMALR
jgi:glyoxylase-like metal-dependent hydrolase (beta-lactamase superfamily II)